MAIINNFPKSFVNDSLIKNLKRVSVTFTDPELGINKNYKKLSSGYYILNGTHYDQNHNVCHFNDKAFENV